MNAHINLYGYVRQCLLAKRITQRRIAAGSGVPYSTVSKIAQDAVKNPSVHTIQRLADFFAKEELPDFGKESVGGVTSLPSEADVSALS